MNIYAQEGDKVVFKNKGGYSGDFELASTHLELGGVYTVDYTIVGSWETVVYLKEVPSVGFNSVLFSDK